MNHWITEARKHKFFDLQQAFIFYGVSDKYDLTCYSDGILFSFDYKSDIFCELVDWQTVLRYEAHKFAYYWINFVKYQIEEFEKSYSNPK